MSNKPEKQLVVADLNFLSIVALTCAIAGGVLVALVLFTLWQEDRVQTKLEDLKRKGVQQQP
jgi:hypothetical protein